MSLSKTLLSPGDRRPSRRYDPEIPVVLGRHFQYLGDGGLHYVSGGAGYAVSRAAVEKLRTVSDWCLP